MKKYVFSALLAFGMISQAQAQSMFYYICSEVACETAAIQDWCKTNAPKTDTVKCLKRTERLSLQETGKAKLGQILQYGCAAEVCGQYPQLAQLCVAVAQRTGLQGNVKNCAARSNLSLTKTLALPAPAGK